MSVYAAAHSVRSSSGCASVTANIITDLSSREPLCWSFAFGFSVVIPANELMLNRLYHIFGGFFSSTSMSTLASWSRKRGGSCILPAACISAAGSNYPTWKSVPLPQTPWIGEEMLYYRPHSQLRQSTGDGSLNAYEAYPVVRSRA